MKKRAVKDYLLLSAKGVAMGAADVVPGVSGGTIAFITGIYEELLTSIANVNLDALKLLKTSGFKAFWNHVNGTFFVFLLGGIIVSIASLANLIQYLLSDFPIPTWSFFFGLIVASVGVVFAKIKKKNNAAVWLSLVAGTVIAFFITLATPTQGTDNLFYLFVCGSIAIVAMILPGISGSFILLLLGAYLTMMQTISNFIHSLRQFAMDGLIAHGTTIVVFILGCVCGLLLFSRALKWMFRKAHDITVAALTGFLIGSLNKVWPWKEIEKTFIKHAGTEKEKVVPLIERNVMPHTYSEITGEPDYVLIAAITCIIGFVLVVGLNRFSPQEETKL